MSTTERALTPTYPVTEMQPSPVPDIGRIDKREAVSKNHADCITRIEGLGLQLARQFQKLEELRNQMESVGIRTEPILDAHVDAARVAWQSNRQGEAPLGRPIP